MSVQMSEIEYCKDGGHRAPIGTNVAEKEMVQKGKVARERYLVPMSRPTLEWFLYDVDSNRVETRDKLKSRIEFC